ncbi:ATP-binding protein [Alistipes finegoldii]|mgnify:FL=1|uniref:PAS domain-containing sensor histidine kinase n=1 Tax=Alistipes finegoldii TaxID=214856 RepID=UPI003A862812
MRRTPHPRGGDFAHPLNISDILSVCHDRQDLLPGILARLRERHRYGDLPPWSYIRLRDSNLKFYIEGRFVGRYDRRRQLRRIVFLFRNTEEEITRKFILGMALSQTKIFPWFFDLGHNRMVIDERWFAHLGLPAGDGTIGTEDFFRLVHPEDRGRLADAFAKQLAGEMNPDTFTYRLRRGDGTWEWFEEQSVYLGQTGDGSPCRIVGICQSIHAHKTSEDGLRAARDKARESDRLKSAFLANMSHEIRTPLNAIIGFANLLTSEDIPFSEAEKQEYSRLITSNGDQLLRLISDILDLSKIESNTMEFHFGEHSLHALLTDIYQAQRLCMPEGVRLRLDMPQADTPIVTDASRLKQVVNNLINNAAKFTDNGSITFGFRSPQGCEKVELFVHDTGKGIAQEHLDRIFERFYKADSFVKGVGLGLSICRTITEYLGGAISVESESGKGTRFTIQHPLSRPEAAPRREPAETAGMRQ